MTVDGEERGGYKSDLTGGSGSGGGGCGGSGKGGGADSIGNCDEQVNKRGNVSWTGRKC